MLLHRVSAKRGKLLLEKSHFLLFLAIRLESERDFQGPARKSAQNNIQIGFDHRSEWQFKQLLAVVLQQGSKP